MCIRDRALLEPVTIFRLPDGHTAGVLWRMRRMRKTMGPPRSVRAAQTRGGAVGLASVFRAEKIWFWVVALKYANHTKMGPGGRTDHPLLVVGYGIQTPRIITLQLHLLWTEIYNCQKL